MVALLLMLMVLDGKKSFKKKIVYSALSAFALSTGILIWTGAQYIFAVYMGALIMLDSLRLRDREAGAGGVERDVVSGIASGLWA